MEGSFAVYMELKASEEKKEQVRKILKNYLEEDEPVKEMKFKDDVCLYFDGILTRAYDFMNGLPYNLKKDLQGLIKTGSINMVCLDEKWECWDLVEDDIPKEIW